MLDVRFTVERLQSLLPAVYHSELKQCALGHLHTVDLQRHYVEKWTVESQKLTDV